MVKLSQALEGKNVRITDTNGRIYEGHVGDYIYADDNAPKEIESIVLDSGFRRSDGRIYDFPTEFLVTEIADLKLL